MITTSPNPIAAKHWVVALDVLRGFAEVLVIP